MRRSKHPGVKCSKVTSLSKVNQGLLHKMVRFETYLLVGTNLRGWYVYISKFCYTKHTYLQICTYQ